MNNTLYRAFGALGLSFAVLSTASAQDAQQPPQSERPPSPAQLKTREAQQLDSRGQHADARALFQQLIDSATTPRERAAAQRRMAMSYGFENNCAKAIEYEEMVIGYWQTRESAEPQNAFYQQGEMANEAARVCIDAGNLDEAERMYRRGSELGNREPEPRTHPASIWDYRLHHALARIAARRGNKAEAEWHVAAARRTLDADTAMARQQERFYPYLTGYVALYTGDLSRAESEMTRALAIEQNQRDPFMHALLGMTYEKMGRANDAKTAYEKSYSLATSHNPPAAFSRPFARRKLGLKPE
jgi:tetratricopeptide (TPR) repeat protein